MRGDVEARLGLGGNIYVHQVRSRGKVQYVVNRTPSEFIRSKMDNVLRFIQKRLNASTDKMRRSWLEQVIKAIQSVK